MVDSGLARVPRFSPRTGMTRLETVRVNRASAEQRRGRAGRLAPGVCYRLMDGDRTGPACAPQARRRFSKPISRRSPSSSPSPVSTIRSELSWLDAPPEAALSQARELLRELEAIDRVGRVTEHGRAVARLALHPRLAHMIIRSIPLAVGLTACRLAALLNERDLLRGERAPPEVDLRTRLDLVAGKIQDSRVDRGTLPAHSDRGRPSRAPTRRQSWRGYERRGSAHGARVSRSDRAAPPRRTWAFFHAQRPRRDRRRHRSVRR